MKQFKRIVKAAQKKEPEAFAKLYEQTYHEKYYIALKYMKHPSEAEDVLQEAYIKAWERLPSLKDADKFSSWLGQIVARTALDALKRKKPMLFSELTDTEGESEDFLSELPDDHQELQPELAYTEKERSEILGHMLDSLSDVQRLCMMMYYIEEMSIHEIAEILECSENTVKSRLNYGRKNMQKAAVKLEKEGYHFYGLSPVYLFLYLLQLEAAESGILLPVLCSNFIYSHSFSTLLWHFRLYRRNRFHHSCFSRFYCFRHSRLYRFFYCLWYFYFSRLYGFFRYFCLSRLFHLLQYFYLSRLYFFFR